MDKYLTTERNLALLVNRVFLDTFSDKLMENRAVATDLTRGFMSGLGRLEQLAQHEAIGCWECKRLGETVLLLGTRTYVNALLLFLGAGEAAQDLSALFLFAGAQSAERV